MPHPLYVAIFWHMHQPLYRNLLTGDYKLPWVRLHGTKDYLHMGRLLLDYPTIHQTFNFVPSLLEQILDYCDNEATDRWLEVSVKESLTAEDKRFMLAQFFSINWDRVVKPNSHYWRLLQVANAAGEDSTLLSRQFWRDLAAWFNLAWIDPEIVAADPELRALRERGHGYNLADVRAIVAKHYAILREILPLFRRLQGAGQVELTTSPYFHPILPLLVDESSALMASPNLSLPDANVRWPEDAAEQLRRGMEKYQDLFGRAPRGLWPSEGAISPGAVALLKGRRTFNWVASDEAILARSQGAWFDRDGYGHVLDARRLYQPYLAPEGNTTLVFRDRVLSDRIGFVYQHMDAREAAEDLIGRLHHVRETLNDGENPYLIPIILDGENCWEGYANNGNDFLRHLYGRLAADSTLRTVTIGEYLERFPARQKLSSLFSGSWINQNLETWIGESDQNRAWEYLARARSRLIAWQNQYALADPDTLANAWEQVYIAEGSDWFWWYYSHNKTGHEQLFDVEYRGHLADIYAVMGQPPPQWLKEPIATPGERPQYRPVSGKISPRLSGQQEASLEWAGAGYVEPVTSSGTMQMGASLLRRLYFGSNPAALFLRLEANEDVSRYQVSFYLTSPSQSGPGAQIRFLPSKADFTPPDLAFAWEVSLLPGAEQASLSSALGGDVWELSKQLSLVAVGPHAVEVCLPLADIGLHLGDEVDLLATVAKGEVLAEVLPRLGYVSFTLS
ncbi:MAG: glycoside hydrolase family 57 protein [Chloroflexi bacterium]|nr:glycoside hydrolase family 57 protein [Chloroflexota bacterium]